MNSFVFSYYFSVIVQIISLFIQTYGYTLKVNPKLYALKYALNLEFFVSIIELLVYFWIGTNLSNLGTVMNKRYLDWFLTTNCMMISFSFMFIFFNQRQKDKSTNKEDVCEDSCKTLIHDNLYKFAPILLFNNAMLIIGYLGEKQIISKLFSTTFGFASFFMSFYYLYIYFAKYSSIGPKILYAMAFIWALYGVAHNLRETSKNISYNLLDLVSKNAFGVILVFMILHYQKSNI
jgi:hypothetical protein